MKKYIVFFLTMATMALSSCRQEADDLESQMFLQSNGTSLTNCLPQTYTEQFDVLWNGVNQNYVAWQLEDYDWDEVYRTKRSVPMAWDKRLEEDPNDTISDDEFKKFYKDIVSPFHDHHFCAYLWNLRTKQNKMHFLSPGIMRLEQRDNYDEFDRLTTVRDKCMDKEKTSLAALTLESLDKRGQLAPIGNEPFITFKDLDNGFMAELAVIKTANGKYAPYLHWNTFMFTRYLRSEQKDDRLYEEGTASRFLQTYGDVVKTYGEAGQLGGVILDVRGNGGGSTADYAQLIGRLLEPGKDMVLGSIVQKNGVGRLDYGPSTPFGFSIYDYGQYVVRQEPIIVLCDGFSVSMSEQTTYTAKLLPNGHVIGDRTFGGFDILDQQYDHTYAGSFGDSEKGPLYVYTPCSLMTPIDGTKMESIGIMPDEYIPYNEEIVNGMTRDLHNITDAHIEAAIKYIQGKK